jgi:hypothetical protein
MIRPSTQRNQHIISSDDEDAVAPPQHERLQPLSRHRLIHDSDCDGDKANPDDAETTMIVDTAILHQSVVDVDDTSSDGLQDDEIWVQASKSKPNPPRYAAENATIACATSTAATSRLTPVEKQTTSRDAPARSTTMTRSTGELHSTRTAVTPQSVKKKTSLATRKAETPKSAKKQKKSPRTAKRNFQGEAEEASYDESEESCDESASDARAQYTSAILGVRNARHARQQRRTSTAPCAVCAQFSAFLENFVQ